MKKSRILLSVILLMSIMLSISNASCREGKTTTDEKQISQSKVAEIINDNLNLIFITTEWCAASKYVLENSYIKLCDSLPGNVNVVVLVASETDKTFSNYLNGLGIKCPYYVLPNKKSHEKVIEHRDRKRIRHFIKTNLKGYEDLKLGWQFGVPISLFVNRNLEIISEAPQEYNDIKREVLRLKNNAE